MNSQEHAQEQALAILGNQVLDEWARQRAVLDEYIGQRIVRAIEMEPFVEQQRQEFEKHE